MKHRRNTGSLTFDIANYLFLGLLMFVMLYPMLNIVAVSLSSPSMISAGKVTWFPRGFTMIGYKYMLSDMELVNSYGNTIAYALTGTFFTLLFTSLAAYPLSIQNFCLKKSFTFYLALTMFISGGLIPTFLVIKSMNMVNTFWVMVVPGCVSAYTVFIFRSFFQGLPVSLRESATLDGANDLRIWFQIILPLSKPLLATFFLFTMVGHWNSWFTALIYLTDRGRYPLQLVLRRLVVDENMTSMYSDSAAGELIASGVMNPKNAQMAAVVLAMTPILIVYPFIQKYFAKGVIIGAIKG